MRKKQCTPSKYIVVPVEINPLNWKSPPNLVSKPLIRLRGRVSTNLNPQAQQHSGSIHHSHQQFLPVYNSENWINWIGIQMISFGTFNTNTTCHIIEQESHESFKYRSDVMIYDKSKYDRILTETDTLV